MLTAPMSHQRAALSRLREGARALPMEMGTGKSRVALEFAEVLAVRNVIVVAPNGVHRGWIEREVPKHTDWDAALLYTAQAAKTQKWRAARDAFLAAPPGKPRILALNVEAFSHSRSDAIRLVQTVLASGPTLFVVDESDTIKSPSAQRTRALWRLGAAAEHRLIMTGTLIAECPFDAYAQFRFLSPTLLGFATFAAFKAHYGVFVQRSLVNGRTYPDLIRYRNLDELKRRIDAHSFTVRKRDCLDLPDKAYITRFVELPEDHKRLYNAAKKQLILELESGQLNLSHALTRLLRLAQIAGGFIPDPTPRPVAATNPKLESLSSLVYDIPSDAKVIIWARFQHECRAIAALFGAEAVEYHGGIPEAQRARNLEAFLRTPGPRFFVGTPTAGGRGLTLTVASYVVYFSNDFSLATRLQSEDRAHRIGQTNKVTYIDLVATGTIDSKILSLLERKRSVADAFATPGELAEWLKDEHE